MGWGTFGSTPSVYFVTGPHRGGTTILSEAIADAVSGSMVTVSDLTSYLPRLKGLIGDGDQSDGTVANETSHDVSPETSVEYCWFLYSASKQRSFRFKRSLTRPLSNLITEVKDRAGSDRIVLKNPWDAGNEALLLSEFDDACAIVIRRDVQAIEASTHLMMEEGATPEKQDVSPFRDYESEDYLRALMDDNAAFRGLVRALRRPGTRWLLNVVSRWIGRLSILFLVRQVRKVPLHRIGFISYDEMSEDPVRGAQWLGHLLDPVALATSFGRVAGPARKRSPEGSRVVRALDRHWERAWSDMRRRQIEAGILAQDS